MIRHEARGGLADGIARAIDSTVPVNNDALLAKMRADLRGCDSCADYAANVGRDMWLGGIQECLRLAKIYVKSEQDRVFSETAQPYDEIDWTKFEKQLERL